MSAPSVVVINNDPVLVTLLEQALADAGYYVIGAVGRQQGVAAIRAHHPDLVVLDAPYDPSSTDWFILRFTWQDGERHQAHTLPMPLQLQQLHTMLGQVLHTSSEPPPMERNRGA